MDSTAIPSMQGQSVEAWHGVEEDDTPHVRVPLSRVVTIIEITDAGPPVPYEVNIPVVSSHWANMIP